MIVRNIDDYTVSVAHYVPTGDLWASKWIGENVFYKLLSGLSLIILEADTLLTQFQDEFYPNGTTEFLSEWEALLGIPDGCIEVAGSIEQRQSNVLGALAALGAVTHDDWINLAKVMGFDITIEYLNTGNTFPLTLPYTVGDSKYIKNTIKIVFQDLELAGSEFPLTLPYTLSEDLKAGVKCIFERIKPAHVQIIFEDVSVESSNFILANENNFIFESGNNFTFEN
ncbi:DUF2313 domain-containing protein [Candidatus Pacearchaeota archaeon]|nr:DUF2313 domain-containing protein [Candidatus Pacearchaeota archaeon]